MNDNRATLLHGFEVHSVELIRGAMANGVDVTSKVAGKRPVDELVEMYFRSRARVTRFLCAGRSSSTIPVT